MNEPQSLQEKIAKSWNQHGARKSSQSDTFSMYLWGVVGFGSIIFLIKEYLTGHNSTMVLLLWVLLASSVAQVALAYLRRRMVKPDIQAKREGEAPNTSTGSAGTVEGEVVEEKK